MTKLRIVVAQLNFWVGDIAGNLQKMLTATVRAQAEFKASAIIFPELALSGYPPEDLLLRDDFNQQIAQALTQLQQASNGITIIVGHPHKEENNLYNAATVLCDQQKIITYYKQILPNYGVFDEKRYFTPGKQVGVFSWQGHQCGLLICEDLWHPEPMAQAAQAGAEVIFCLNASPFHLNKPHQREQLLQQRIQETRLPIIYVHGVGGHDDLIFDGGSMVMNAQQHLCAHAGFYQEHLMLVELDETPQLSLSAQPILTPTLSAEASVYQALVLSVRDYVQKNRFPGVLLGLSGGIDSALTLAIAVDALGPEVVHAILMPSRYTSQLSLDTAQQQAQQLGVQHSCISIEPAFNAFMQLLAPEFAGLAADITEENLQARCRGVLLMALSNKTRKLVLTTGNKSEIAVGYSTLYGDMAGGFDVLKDVPKTLVYRLANYRNGINPAIPQAVIDRPPTAELALNQTDQDSLPPYPVLDQILELYVEQDKSKAEIIAQGFPATVVSKVIRLVDMNEYKRRQAPPGPRITSRAFGRERRYPITKNYQTD